jgi:hypothetical protein
MWYEINVALNGRHFFATSERSITHEFDLEMILPVMKQKFPKEEGYEITVTRWEKVGHHCFTDELNE